MTCELYHHGILGMHWGIRRYQNKDGTWTSAGKKRYGGSQEALDLDQKLEKYSKVNNRSVKSFKDLSGKAQEKQDIAKSITDSVVSAKKEIESLNEDYLTARSALTKVENDLWAQAKKVARNTNQDSSDVHSKLYEQNERYIKGYIEKVNAAERKRDEAVDNAVDDILGKIGSEKTKDAYSYMSNPTKSKVAKDLVKQNLSFRIPKQGPLILSSNPGLRPGLSKLKKGK